MIIFFFTVHIDDVAINTIKTINAPRVLNKTLYLRPPENILTQSELIETWEKLKDHISVEDFLASEKGEYIYITEN